MDFDRMQIQLNTILAFVKRFQPMLEALEAEKAKYDAMNLERSEEYAREKAEAAEADQVAAAEAERAAQEAAERESAKAEADAAAAAKAAADAGAGGVAGTPVTEENKEVIQGEVGAETVTQQPEASA